MMNIQEKEIQVPWGHLAVRVWGDQNDPMVLVFHGIMDNAGSFDRLIPLLPTVFCYICVDLPGHGKSSPFPPFFPLYSINNILVYKLVMRHFMRKSYIIMGHSYGGQIGFLFTKLYPELVEKLIMLDTVHLSPVHPDHFVQYLRDRFDFCIYLYDTMQNKKRPTYTYAEALQKLQEQRAHGYISPEAAEALMQRGVARMEDGKYAFIVDPRAKSFLNPLHDFPYIIDTLKKHPVTCPVLVVLRRNFLPQEMFKSVINFYKKCKNFRMVVVDGHHDVHNNNPENVAPFVTKFLLEKKVKL